MLDQIINIIKTQASHVIAGNTEIPAEKKEQVVDTTTNAMVTGLKENINAGNLMNLANLFSGDIKTSETMNPLLEKIKSTITGALTGQAGLSAGTSNSIADTLVPMVFRIFSNKVKDPNEKGFNLQSLVQSFIGKKDNAEHESLLSKIGDIML